MSEPGAPTPNAPVATQPNNQGNYSRTHYTPFIPTGGTSGGSGVYPTNGGVGFGDSQVADSKEANGPQGEHDEVRDDEFTNQSEGIKEDAYAQNTVPESPFVTYVQKPLSAGNDQKPQRYYNSREMGRGTNKGDIRKAFYFGEQEADIFKWNLPSSMPTSRAELENSEYPKFRDV